MSTNTKDFCLWLKGYLEEKDDNYLINIQLIKDNLKHALLNSEIKVPIQQILCGDAIGFFDESTSTTEIIKC